MEPGAVLAKWLNKTVPFDVTSDFSPIAMVATSPLVLFAHPSLPNAAGPPLTLTHCSLHEQCCSHRSISAPLCSRVETVRGKARAAERHV
jgi:hypothetical protein